MTRSALRRQVIELLGNRALVWAGVRGDDAEPLMDLPQLEATYTILNAYRRRPLTDSMAYEDLTGTRVDLEVWDIDEHRGDEATTQFRRGMLRFLSRPSALLPYRPSNFLSAVWFARRDRCLNLGLFGAHQNAFEHKPWVETEVARLGVPHIPWTYIADEDQLDARKLLRSGPVMLRRSRTSGGEGLTKVEDQSDLVARWPKVDEAFVSVAPYLADSLPVNVGATVWSGGVTVHHPSVQLIGIPSCATRPFGYCGNDFGLMRQVDRAILDQIEGSTVAIGRWLGRYGYLGTFGVDYLVHQGIPLFTEVNARFQGSTHASCQLSIQADQSCLMLEHIAAVLGLEPPPRPPLRDLVADVAALSHLVVHWTGNEPARLDTTGLAAGLAAGSGYARSDALTSPSLLTNPGATVGRFTTNRCITTTGYDLDPEWDAAVSRWASGSIPDTEKGNHVAHVPG